MMTRAIFRRFTKHFKKDYDIRQLIKRGDKKYAHFKEVLDWALESETIYKNESQEGSL